MKYTEQDLLQLYVDKSKQKGKWLTRGEFNIDRPIRRLFGQWQDFQSAVEIKFGINLKKVAPNSNNFLQNEPKTFFDTKAAREKLNRVINYTKKSNPPQAKKSSLHKLLVLPCLHVPFHAENNLAAAVEWAKSQKVDTLIIAGDFLDCLSVGHAGYKRNIRHQHFVSLKEEFSMGKVILEHLSNSFPNVKMMRGNHPERVRKYFTERVGPELMWLVQHDIITLLSHDFPNVEMVNTVDHNNNDISWLYQVGDCRITHAEVGSSIELRPTVKVHDWFSHWNHYFSDLPPYNVLIECHTHQSGILPIDNCKKILVEGGCLCLEPQYAVEPAVKYKHPQTNCVTYFEQTNGVTDINSIRQYLFQDMK